MNKRYHASASQTLAAIQSLYEAKLLSYPRTDCAYITDEEFDYLVANLTKYLGLVSKQVALTNTTPNKRYVNGKKVEEHYAIIMTKVVPTKEKLASLPKLQQQFYDLVLITTLAMFADPYEYEETTIVTQVGDWAVAVRWSYLWYSEWCHRVTDNANNVLWRAHLSQRVLLCFATKLKSVLANSHNYAAVKWSQYVVIIDTPIFTVLTMLMWCDKLPLLRKL